VALSTTSLARIRVLLVIVVALTALAASFWLGTRQAVYHNTAPVREKESAASGFETPSPFSTSTVSPDSAGSSAPSSNPSPVPIGPNADASPAPENFASPQNSIISGSFVGKLQLIIPVVGVKPDQLRDTFMDARSEGRAHDAIDIMAPAGTPVVAASDGEIVRLFQSERGGTTIYQLSPDKKLVFYYAHLQRYADGLVVGKFARQGEVIAYVGDTGNAGAGNYHLHFSIAVLADPKRYWDGTNINPYPLLRR
jgi:murein DD-endopeptidase MepM/ murein hydrolase activator NlpD